MKLHVMIPIIVIALGTYFILSLIVLPEQYLAKEQSLSEPILDVFVSDPEISLGETFEVKVVSKNIGETADILITSIAFPELETINDNIKIVSYDFTQSPTIINLGDEIGAEYLSVQKTITAKYPSIEAYTRPAKPDVEYHITLEITPVDAGRFIFYTKAITLPHLASISHIPRDGQTDHQGEFVDVYSVMVNP